MAYWRPQHLALFCLSLGKLMTDDEMTKLCCFAVSVLWSSGESFSFWGLFECSRVSITAPPIRHQKVLRRRRYSDWTMFRGSFQADLLLQFQDFVTRVLLRSSSQAIWCISMQGSFPSARMGRPSFATPTVWLVLEGWRDAGLNLAVGEAWRRSLAMVVDGRRTQMSFCCSTV